MQTSVNNYARYLNPRRAGHWDASCSPICRLDEFLNAQKNAATDPWHLSGIVSGNIEADLAAVDEFNRKSPGAVMDCVEVRVNTPDEIGRVRQHQPAGTTVFFEIAPERAGELLPILRPIGGKAGCHTWVRAKLRTGGVVQDAFPSVEQVAGFILRCAELGVPFKATAGLHHPLRCVHPFTYAADSPAGVMHGFLNLFTAAALAWSATHSGGTLPLARVAACLADGERAHWLFSEDALTWSGDVEPVRIRS